MELCEEECFLSKTEAIEKKKFKEMVELALKNDPKKKQANIPEKKTQPEETSLKTAETKDFENNITNYVEL